MQTIKLEYLATANRVMAVIRRIHREMDSDFQINGIKDRRVITGRVNQKEILQRESHMRNRTRNKLGGGTKFTSSLTKEFLKMFGITPRFNTPGHPESSRIVEKWNQTFKKMIH